MKNIADIFSYSTEENFKEEGRPEKWVDLTDDDYDEVLSECETYLSDNG